MPVYFVYDNGQSQEPDWEKRKGYRLDVYALPTANGIHAGTIINANKIFFKVTGFNARGIPYVEEHYTTGTERCRGIPAKLILQSNPGGSTSLKGDWKTVREQIFVAAMFSIPVKVELPAKTCEDLSRGGAKPWDILPTAVRNKLKLVEKTGKPTTLYLQV